MTIRLSPKAQASLDAVVARFQSGDLSDVVKVAQLHSKGDISPMANWSFNNQVWAYMQSGGQIDCRGIDQWRRVGRHPRKGGHAVWILGGKPWVDEERDARGVRFFSIPVFPLDQTEGDPLPEAQDYEPAEMPPLADLARQLGTELVWAPGDRHTLGSCTVDGSKITLHSHDPYVFFHELGHRIHAKLEGKLKGGQHVDQETIADFTACVLMHLYGYGDYTGNTWRYIGMYARDPIRAISKAMCTVESVLSFLFGKEETHDADDLSLAAA